MSYIVYARKYRPTTFDEIVGQDHIAATLKNAVRMGKVAHAYLFSGPRGIGKTTTARILAKALNCEKPSGVNPCNKCASCGEISSGTSMDVIEIDGASNRGIDEVRELRENVKFSPTRGKYKLYIIDEVHMLTPEAFNALLKTLEEPPPHVKFVFATTRPDKVLSTVSSRCQRFDFHRISTQDIAAKLKMISGKESITADEEALYAIARHADGSLRDAESILDQLATLRRGKINREDVAAALGRVSEGLLGRFADILAERDAQGALLFVDRILKDGKDLSFFLASLIEYFRNLLIAAICGKPEDLIDLAPDTVRQLRERAERFSRDELLYIMSVLSGTGESIRRSASVRPIFELAVVKIAHRASMTGLEELVARVEGLRKKLEKEGNHGFVPDDRRQGAKTGTGPSERSLNRRDQSPDNSRGVEQGGLQAGRAADGDVSVPAEGRQEGSIPSGDAHSGSAHSEPAAATAPDIEITRLEEIWPTFLTVLRSKKMSVASYLLEGEISSCGDGAITLGFPKNYRLHKETLEGHDNKQLIEKTLSDILKAPVRIKFVTMDVERRTDSPTGGKNAPESDEPSREEILKEPIIQSALEVFDGRIVKKR